jgi:putative flippase GtrA
MFRRLKIFVKAQFSAFVGGLCDYLIMIFLVEVFGLYYVLAIAVSCMLGAVINFSLNKIWTFYSREKSYQFTLPQQLRRFIFVVASSILLKMSGTFLLTTLSHLDYKISRLIADLLVSLLFNYVLQRYWVFKKQK